jgi:hypothetical protein
MSSFIVGVVFIVLGAALFLRPEPVNAVLERVLVKPYRRMSGAAERKGGVRGPSEHDFELLYRSTRWTGLGFSIVGGLTLLLAAM